MAETENQTDGNGMMEKALANAQPVGGVPMKEGVTYMMVPAPLMVELVKILGKLPFEDVEGVMGGLRQCAPVRTGTGAPAE